MRPQSILRRARRPLVHKAVDPTRKSPSDDRLPPDP